MVVKEPNGTGCEELCMSLLDDRITVGVLPGTEDAVESMLAAVGIVETDNDETASLEEEGPYFGAVDMEVRLVRELPLVPVVGYIWSTVDGVWLEPMAWTEETFVMYAETGSDRDCDDPISVP